MYNTSPRGGWQCDRLGSLLNYAGLTLLLLLFSQRLLRLPFMLTLRVSSAFGQLASLAIYAMSLLLTIMVAHYLLGRDSSFVFPMTPVRRDYLAPAVLSALGVVMLGNLAASLAMAGLGSVGIYSSPNMPSWNNGIVVVVITILCSTVLPAFCEELLFRGLLLQPLRRYGDRLAVIASSLIFALAHPTLPQAISAFVAGLVLGVLAVRSGSLVAPMLVHFIYNSIACAISLTAAYHPLVGGIASWAVLLLLVVIGLVAMVVLRHRFGVVWRLSHDGEPHEHTWRLALTSVPLVAAALLCFVTIVRNLHYLPVRGWLP